MTIALAMWRGGDVQKTALKLHRQFGHPTPTKLIRLITDAGIKNSALERAVEKVTKECDTCLRFQKAKPRPVVCMPMASTFNEVIAMDLKAWGNKYFLVIVDLATRYSMATVIGNKCATTIVKGLFKSWIAVFGAPGKLLSDNGLEFNNDEMRALGEAFNIKIMTTSAESPWSNGVCERQNAVIGDIVRKIVDESGCDLEVALAWAVSARNTLTNYAGFSPNQLVFGHNPGLPNVYQNDPPALEITQASDIVRNNLNALHVARREFLKTESSERLSRALRHNIRSSDLNDVQNGDEVFYKRAGHNEWHGPGIVIGRDGKQVLVRHGGVYVRVHVCRLTRGHSARSNGNKSEDSAVDKDGEKTLSIEESDEESEESSEEAEGTSTRETETEEAEGTGTRETETVTQPKVKVGQRIQGVHKISGELKSGRVLSRAGKSTGKYKDCYNVKWDLDGSESWVDVREDFSDLQVMEDNVEMMVLFNSEEVLCAKKKEIKSWQENDVYEEVDDVGQDTLSVRWVVTEKNKDKQSVIKARLVARGFEEDTMEFRKDSPTCSKEAVRLALTIAATNNWDSHTLDVKVAYLQGDKIERVVHLRPPPEFNCGRLWKLKKTVYGLCDAARQWYLRVKRLLLDLGASVSSLDPALFFWKQGDKIEGVVCTYVDDFLWAGTPVFKKQVIDKLCHTFLIGSTETKAFKYVGLNIISYKDGSKTIDQFQYASTLTPIAISRQRANMKSSELSETERAEYRALVGQLNWIATHSRPDIAFDVCELSVASKRATVADLLQLNKVIARVKTDNVKLYMPRMEKMEDCHMECYSDASFANLPGCGSQSGVVIFIGDGYGRRCPVFWQSRKIRRVVKSTLSAETLALLEGAESAVYLSKILREISGCGDLKINCFVDNKSLVDALYSCRSIEDRRLRIDMAVLRDMLERKEITEVAWIDTSQQLADCLTKKGASPERLRAAVSRD